MECLWIFFFFNAVEDIICFDSLDFIVVFAFYCEPPQIILWEIDGI